MILAKLVVLGVLGYTSLEDLRRMKIKKADKIFLGALLFSVGIGAVTQGLPYAGSMIIQGLLAGVAGLFIRAVSKFGGADIWALVLASAVFPETLLFSVLAFLLVPMLFWLKIYSFATRKDYGPALPGLLIGYLIMLSYLGL